MRLAFAALLAALMIAGCSTHRGGMSPADSGFADVRADQADSGPAAVPAQASIELDEAALEDADLRIQRTGVIKLDVKEQMSFSAELRKNAPAFNAIVMAFSDRSVKYRMPSAKLEALLKWLGEQDPKLVELDSFDFSALDRTGEFFSVEARLEAVKAARTRTMELLKLAQDLPEIERIEAKLEAQQAGIDSYETTLFDIKLRAGRVDVRIQME